MPILVDFVFQFLRLRTYKSSITLLLFQMSGNGRPNPNAILPIIFENDEYIAMELSSFVLFSIKSVPMMLRTIRNKDFYAGFRIISCNFVLMNRNVFTD